MCYITFISSASETRFKKQIYRWQLNRKFESYTFDVDGMDAHGKITEDRESSWLITEWLMTDDHIAD